jgi:hypothetical protein
MHRVVGHRLKNHAGGSLVPCRIAGLFSLEARLGNARKCRG